MSEAVPADYAEILKKLRTCFPSPKSDPVMDGYFVHTLSHFLDQVDSLKGAAPVLGAEAAAACELHAAGRETLPIRPGRARQELPGFPEAVRPVEEVTKILADYCRGITIWAHPNVQANVIPPSTIPSITAVVAAAIYNPNIIWDEYSAGFADAEKQVVAAASELVGYEPEKSSGLFTFGGTGTVLYGCKLGLEKALGGTMAAGLREAVALVASDEAHYARLSVAGWLGIGTANVIDVPTGSDNAMLLPELEMRLREAFEAGKKIAAIVATLLDDAILAVERDNPNFKGKLPRDRT
jgi:glutamate/tyrosine decarboxylase-like PLP-dependent enzyme